MTEPPPPGKSGGGRLGAIFLTVFLDLLGFGLVIPLFPRYAETFHASPFVIGLLGASYSAMQFVFVPVWGALSDRIGRRPVLLGSMLATSLSMMTLAFAPSLGFLFAARIFGGIATANIATAQAYIADSTTHETRARGMGLIGAAFGLGFILGPFFGGALSTISLATPALGGAALALINFVWAFLALPESLPPERRAAPRAIRFGLDLRALDRVRALSSGRGGVVVAIGLFFIVTVSFANLEQTFSLFTHDEFQLDAKHTGWVLAMVGVIAVVVQGGLIGRLHRRFGALALIRTGNLLQCAGFAGLAASTLHGVAAMCVAMALLSLGNGLVNPSISTLVSKRAPPESQGEVLGVMQSMGALARVLGPTWGGLVYGLGHRLPYVTGAIGLFGAWLVAMSIVPVEGEAR